MASLHKLKLLATHCAVAGSPSRSPTNSPLVHLRRRNTLRMFLARTGGARRRFPDSRDRRGKSPEKGRESKNKLKDLFLSSPPVTEKEVQSLVDEGDSESSSRGVSAWRRVGRRSLRPMSAAVRQRLLGRGAWRPALGPIPE